MWNYGYVGDDVRTVDVTVRRLREKIEVDPANPVFILTRRGCGLLLRRIRTPQASVFRVPLSYSALGSGRHLSIRTVMPEKVRAVVPR